MESIFFTLCVIATSLNVSTSNSEAAYIIYRAAE